MLGSLTLTSIFPDIQMSRRLAAKALFLAAFQEAAPAAFLNASGFEVQRRHIDVPLG
jgi:hypothetical protein